jgi:hypothetical protein
MPIGFHDLSDTLLVDQPRIGEITIGGTYHGTQGRKVHIGKNPSFRRLGYIASKYVEKTMACAPRVHNSGHSRTHSKDVRICAEGAQSIHEMQMNIEQSRDNKAAPNIGNLLAVGRQLRADFCYNPVSDPDI